MLGFFGGVGAGEGRVWLLLSMSLGFSHVVLGTGALHR